MTLQRYLYEPDELFCSGLELNYVWQVYLSTVTTNERPALVDLIDRSALSIVCGYIRLTDSTHPWFGLSDDQFMTLGLPVHEVSYAAYGYETKSVQKRNEWWLGILSPVITSLECENIGSFIAKYRFHCLDLCREAKKLEPPDRGFVSSLTF